MGNFFVGLMLGFSLGVGLTLAAVRWAIRSK